jgi:hypothetical protein
MAQGKHGEIQIYFRNSPDYQKIHATGAWGGITPQGQILCDFFFDYTETPETVTLRVSEDGKAEEAARTGKQDVVREVLAGIILRPDHAHIIGAWLQKRAIEAGFQEDAKCKDKS